MTLGPAALLAAAALVQSVPGPPSKPPQNGSDVVVTARPADHARAVRHMTAQMTPTGDASQPLPRFAAPICPDVAGLPGPLADRFAQRMRDDAAAAGLPVDVPGCAPNVTVLLVPDGQAVVRGLHKTKPEAFGDLEPAQVRRLMTDAGPVHVWSFTELRSRDDDRPRVATVSGRQDVLELQVRDASILMAQVRIVVDGAVLLIDQPASVGKTINQLADYAVMRTLAQARTVGSDAGEPTILRLFDPGTTPPPTLTSFDAAYLKALYRGQSTQLSLTKVGLMARDINKSLSQGVPGDERAAKAPTR